MVNLTFSLMVAARKGMLSLLVGLVETCHCCMTTPSENKHNPGAGYQKRTEGLCGVCKLLTLIVMWFAY